MTKDSHSRKGMDKLNFSNIIFLLIAYAAEPLIWMHTLSKIFKRKYNNILSYILCYIGSYMIICAKQYVGIKDISSILEMILFLILISYYFIVYSKIFVAKKTKLIISLCTLFILALVSEFLAVGVATVIGISGNKIATFGIVNTILTLLSKLILLLMCCLVFRKKQETIRYVWNVKEIIPVLLGLIIVEMPIMYMFRHMSTIGYETRVLILFVFAQVILVFLAIYMIAFVIRYVNSEQELKNSMYQTQAEISSYRQYEEKIEELKQTRHDLKSHIGIIRQLCEQGDYKELESYFDKLYGKIESSEYYILENKNVEILLNQMRNQMLKKKISFISEIMAKEMNTIEDIDICSLLSNLLKNAIEATEQLPVEERYIKLSVEENEAGMEIYCENTYITKPVIKHGEYVTTKEEGHGYGVKIIRKISKKYKGNARIDYNEKLFNVKIYMPYR